MNCVECSGEIVTTKNDEFCTECGQDVFEYAEGKFICRECLSRILEERLEES